MKRILFPTSILCALFAIAPLQCALSETKHSVHEGAITIDVTDATAEKATLQITVKTASRGSAQTSGSAFLLDNPNRLVVDLKGIGGKGSKKQTVKSHGVSGVRFGFYPDKTRLVFDLTAGKWGSVTERHADNSLIVTVKPGSEIAVGDEFTDTGKTSKSDAHPLSTSPTPAPTTAKATPAPSKSPTVAPTEKATPSPKATSTPKASPTPKATPTATQTPSPKATPEPSETPASSPIPHEKTPTPSPVATESSAIEEMPSPSPAHALTSIDSSGIKPLPAGAGVISRIAFRMTPPPTTAALVIEVKGLGNYTLNPGGDAEFILTLENAHLGGAHLSLPQFPPDTFDSFTVVTATEKEGSVVVSIHTEDGVRLSPYRGEGGLWVKVEKEGGK